MSVEVLEPGGLAEAEDLIMDESVRERVELVDIVADLATFVSDIFRDKVVGAEGHTDGNDAIRDKNIISVEEFAEVRERVISADHVRSELADVVGGHIPLDAGSDWFTFEIGPCDAVILWTSRYPGAGSCYRKQERKLVKILLQAAPNLETSQSQKTRAQPKELDSIWMS